MQTEDDVPLAEYVRRVRRRYIQDALTAPETIDISHLKPGELHILSFGASMPGFINAGGSTNTFLKRTDVYNDIDFFGPTEIFEGNPRNCVQHIFNWFQAHPLNGVWLDRITKIYKYKTSVEYADIGNIDWIVTFLVCTKTGESQPIQVIGMKHLWYGGQNDIENRAYNAYLVCSDFDLEVCKVSAWLVYFSGEQRLAFTDVSSVLSTSEPFKCVKDGEPDACNFERRNKYAERFKGRMPKPRVCTLRMLCFRALSGHHKSSASHIVEIVEAVARGESP